MRSLTYYKIEIVDPGKRSLLSSGSASDLSLDALSALVRSALASWIDRFERDPSDSNKSELEVFLSIETVRRKSDRKEGGA